MKVTSKATLMHTSKENNGTIIVSLNTKEGEVNLILSKEQALGLGARLIDDATNAILYVLEDARDTRISDTQRQQVLNRYA